MLYSTLGTPIHLHVSWLGRTCKKRK